MHGVETGTVSPLFRVRQVRPEDGPPLRLGRELRRGVQLQVLYVVFGVHLHGDGFRRRRAVEQLCGLFQGFAKRG